MTERRSGPEPYRQYRCVFTRHSASTADPCPAPVLMRQSYVEDEVLAWLGRLERGEGDYDQMLEQQRARERATADVTHLQAGIAEKTAMRGRLLDMKAVSTDPGEIADIDERRAMYAAEIDEMREKVRRIEAQPVRESVPDVEVFAAAAQAFRSSEIAVVNGMLRWVIKKVYIERSSTGRGSRFKPEVGRVKVVGRWEEDPLRHARLRLVEPIPGLDGV